MNPTRLRYLLVFAALLAAVRFGVMPWLEHQADAVERLQVLTKRLDRATGVIENRAEISKVVSEVEAATVAVRQRYPSGTDVQSFRLDVQQKVSAVISQAGLSVKLFEWAVDGEIKDARLQFVRARFQVDGPFRQLVSTQANLEATFPNMAIRELNLVAPVLIAGPDDSPAVMTLVADFYFRPSAAEVAP
jgi:hypothetical protein